MQGAAYSYVDREVQEGATYYYLPEDVDDRGMSTFHGPVPARVATQPDPPPSPDDPAPAQPPLLIHGLEEID